MLPGNSTYTTNERAMHQTPQFLFGAPVALIKRHRRQRMEQILALVELYSPFPTRRFTGLSPLVEA